MNYNKEEAIRFLCLFAFKRIDFEIKLNDVRIIITSLPLLLTYILLEIYLKFTFINTKLPTS